MEPYTSGMSAKQHLLDLSLDQLEAELEGSGEPTYRARQVLHWIFGRQVTHFTDMTDLPGALRDRLDADLSILVAEELDSSKAPDGTTKTLLQWPDGASTETVMIPSQDRRSSGRDRQRRTVCLSTQVGCDVGCRFCASGIGGSQRDLTVGEVMEQALRVAQQLRDQEERLTHVVFMGMGEPLANYGVTMAAVRHLNAEWGLGIGQRRITVSTVGLPTQIERLAREGLQITLALSLHAPNDELRQELIPWARGVPLERLLQACETYFGETGREVTLEYCLLAGTNDSPEHANQLAAIAKRLRAHVNLLSYNPVEGLPFTRPTDFQSHDFLAALRRQGVNAHHRQSRGLEANAACGQLRRRHGEGLGA
jgi:23S rRNA (adenine2503-C2)-methyltransferase